MENNIIYNALLIYSITAIIILAVKPSVFYDDNGNILEFKTGKGGTIFPLWLFMIILGISSYALVIFIKLVRGIKY